MDKEIQKVVSILEGGNYGEIVNLMRSLEYHPQAKEVYEWIASNKPSLMEFILNNDF